LPVVAPNPTPSLPAEARQAWLELADYLAHADRAHGVPPEVRRLLESDAAARAAELAFNEAMTQRDAWLNFARRAADSIRSRNDRAK